MAPQLYFQKAILLLYQVDGFWVMWYVIRYVDPIIMYPLLRFLCCEVHLLVQCDVCGILGHWIKYSTLREWCWLGLQQERQTHTQNVF